jgi:serine/threonine-protein kinase
MSPEQVQGHPLDHRSDIYSFGVTCYHLLAGEPPFRGTSAFDVALKHVQEHPRPLSDLRPDLPAEVCAMVHKMMAKNPDDRYQSARDVLRELQRLRESLAGTNVTLVSAPPNGHPATAGATTDLALSLTQSGATAAPTANPSGFAEGTAPRGRWWLIALACLLATGGGLFAYIGLHRDSSGRSAAAPVQGLPDVRPPERLTTTRERELLTVLNTEGTKPEDAIRASIELGLLYVKEHRSAEATERFEKLKNRGADWRDPVAARFANLAGRLGVAVVLAHDNKAEASNKLFVEILMEPPPKTGKFDGPKFDRNPISVSWLLLRHPDLSSAVADALNRNAANMGKTKLEPAILEQLRSPQRVGKKE